MFRHQTHPRNVHPYQTTVVPRTDAQFHQSAQQRMKYPWLDSHNPQQDGQSTNSSNSETYNVSHQYTNVRPPTSWSTRSHSDGLSSPVYHTPMHDDTGPALYSKPYQSNADMSTYTMPTGVIHDSGSDCCESVVQVSPPALGLASEVPGGCGGHCPGFEYVCYYVLQIIFVVGILTGISLCIAGGVLRRSNRGGDLGVLVYIGCLSSLVCLLLLSIQCCVRRNNKKRNKLMRLRTVPPDTIQLDLIPNLRIDEQGVSIQQAAQVGQAMQVAVPPGTYNRNMQPLLYPNTLPGHSTIPRDYYRSSQRYQQAPQTTLPHDELNGVPWWRRQATEDGR